MSGIIDFRHHATIRYVPRRGRNERFTLRTITTPARLVEVTRAEMPRAGRVDNSWVHAHAGNLWSRSLAGPLLPDFLSALEADIAGATAYRLDYRLEFQFQMGRSPLKGCKDEGMPAYAGPATEPGTRIIRDNSERASRDLVTYLDDNVRVMDGVPFIRLRGPLCRQHEVIHGSIGRPSLHAWTSSLAGTVTTHSNADLALRLWDPPLDRQMGTVGVPAPMALEGVQAPDSYDDVLHFLNTAPCALLKYQRVCPSPAVTESLSPWADLGMFGSVAMTEADDVLDALLEGYAVAAEFHQEHGLAVPVGLQDLERFARDYVRPRIEASLTPDDIEAIEGLSLPAGP